MKCPKIMILLGVAMYFNVGCADTKAVLFDCDGTLVDSMYAHYLAYKLTLHDLGQDDFTPQDFPQYIGKSAQIIAMMFAEKIKKDCADLIIQKKCEHYRNLCESGIPPIEPTVSFLKSLAQEKSRRGIKIGVCSSAKRNDIMLHLRQLGVTELLDIVVSGEDDLIGYVDPDGINKPKPYIYLHAAKMLGISPEQCVVIEDSIPGIDSGVSAGCFTIAVPNDYTKNQDLSHAQLRIETFDGITVERFFQMIGAAGACKQVEQGSFNIRSSQQH